MSGRATPTSSSSRSPTPAAPWRPAAPPASSGATAARTCPITFASPSAPPRKTTPPWRFCPVSKKILFIDRDGTLITEPFDQQIDRLDKFALEPDAIPALLRLRDAGYKFVMVTNQDGLGTPSFRDEEFKPLQKLLLDILASQGIEFEAVRVCPHTPADRCDCR